MPETATRQRVHFIDSESVPGSQYRVTLGAGAKPSCDCPQGKLGRNCKHIERALEKERMEFEASEPEPEPTSEETSQVASQPLPFEEPTDREKASAEAFAAAAKWARDEVVGEATPPSFTNDAHVTSPHHDTSSFAPEPGLERIADAVVDRLSHWAKLREPFPPSQVSKLPRAIGEAARNRNADKRNCDECGGYHAFPSIHLDYVGHAETTSRLLEVDPMWNWEPVAWDDDGLPRFVLNETGDPIGFWIRLTVCGVTRLGYGSCDPGKSDAEKELIGDAIRNAAMRFGVALDLWSKAWHTEQKNPTEKRNSERPRQQHRAPEYQPPDWWPEFAEQLSSAGLQTRHTFPILSRDLNREVKPNSVKELVPFIDTWLGLSETNTIRALVSRSADVAHS